MTTTVVVSYAIKPETLDEHLRLINGVFAELDGLALPQVSYEVLQFDDGVSFMHVSTSDPAAGPNPVPELASFKAFSAGLPGRVTGPPSPASAHVVASYRAAGFSPI